MDIKVPIDVIINEREKQRKKDRDRPRKRKRIPVPEHQDDWTEHPEDKEPARGEVVIQM